MSLELIYKNDDILLESPVYDKYNNFLYFVSIVQNKVYQLNLQNFSIKTFYTDSNVGCVAVKDANAILVAEAQGIYLFDIRTGNKELWTHVINDVQLRYNDGIIDSKGRFLIGTKGILDDYKGLGNLYSIDIDAKSNILVNNTQISNGLALTIDDKILYFIDTPTKKIAKYEYNIQTGKAKFLDYVFDTSGMGYPDGMCIDNDGNLWVALWQGSKVVKINPVSKKLIFEIDLPCKNVTSCCLVDNILYITTAKEKPEDRDGAGLYKYVL